MSRGNSSLFVRLERIPVAAGLRDLRARLYDRTSDSHARRALWSPAVRAAQNDQSPTGQHQLAAVWLALPLLRRAAGKIGTYLPVCRADLESELVTAFLASVAEVDTNDPDVSRWLARAVVNQGWRFAAAGSPERTTADIEAIADQRNLIEPMPAELMAENLWELHVTGPAQPDRLAATIRFTTSSAHREGYRLGELASHMGLREVVHRARRPSEGEPIGALQLIPHGGGS
ncbi:hypothetical protein KGQ20_16475 [Catenulispora sp. NF23]|uniref:hypothetical protein n=1 Tax=Catenulispora pinistramenti TaxID=2705254 RepID=UPI001BA82B0E|nr:hypothetical protein [Catenulispora pinistramenti]MBS2534367.1 hypothetical protein [Catenulispora pinistramenti]